MSQHILPISSSFPKDGGAQLLPTTTESDRDKGTPFGSQKCVLSDFPLRTGSTRDEGEKGRKESSDTWPQEGYGLMTANIKPMTSGGTPVSFLSAMTKALTTAT